MKIERIGIVGYGYVGANLADRLKSYYDLVCYDIDINKVANRSTYHNSNIIMTSEPDELRFCDAYIITVQTPVDNDNQPDLHFLLDATKTVAKYLKQDNIVVYESTVYPGTIENMCLNILEKDSGLQVDKDFLLSYSPERINPNDDIHTLDNTIKIISGHNSEALLEISNIYKKFLGDKILMVDSIKIAESAKLLENLQRDVNIALINEYTQAMKALNIDMKKVLDAANTKWNFMYYYPGLVGGHCIGIDSYYFINFSNNIGITPHLSTAARCVNEKLIMSIYSHLIEGLNGYIKDLSKARIGVLGVSYKKNVADIRNSATIKIINKLKKAGCQLLVFDPLIDQKQFLENTGFNLSSYNDLINLDALLCLVYHDDYKQFQFDYSIFTSEHEPIVIDLYRDLHNIKSTYWLL